MRKFKTLRPVNVNAELILLDENQAARRAHLIKKTKEPGLFRTKGALSFKAGEEIGLADISKTHMSAFEEIKPDKEAKKKPKAKTSGEK